MKNIVVTVSTRHFKAANNYMSNATCPLAMALREKFPGTFVNVGGLTVGVDGANYRIGNWVEQGFQTEDEAANHINDLIKSAKAGNETPDFNVNLELISSRYLVLPKNNPTFVS